MDAIYGVTKELLGELSSKYSELKTQFGERQGEAEFDRFLASKRLDRNTWALAHNAWFERFRADPTGRAEAEFHRSLQQHSLKAHFGDVRDMSQDAVLGVTLDRYAEIAAAIHRQGADADSIVRQHGLQGLDHWNQVNNAWMEKMQADYTVAVQYSQVFEKHAGPQFQEQMLAQTAATLAAGNQQHDVVDEPEEELTPEVCLQKMKSPERNERWRYARLYATSADLGNVPDKAAAIRHVAPFLIEMIEQHDELTTGDADQAVRQLWSLGVRSEDIRDAIGRCLVRAHDKHTNLQVAFFPLQNRAVPERVMLQSQIQDYESLIETMKEFAAHDWSASQHATAAPSFEHRPSPERPAARSGGFPVWLLAPLILVFIGGVLAFTKLGGRSNAMTPASSRTPATTSSGPATASAPAKAPPTATATGTTGTTTPKVASPPVPTKAQKK